MSNKDKYYDNTPFIKVAGVTETIECNADQSLRQDIYFKVKLNIIMLINTTAKHTNPRKNKKVSKILKRNPRSQTHPPGDLQRPERMGRDDSRSKNRRI
jgi:hypothetical protein